ncbi:MAG: TetR/AcrR family transcriptional regulator [Syntrophorhabdales bacterium]|jgi:AcrR family transcriptional regulator
MKEGDKRLSKRRIGIAKAGAELFSRKGFAETSMEDISVAARLSKGGIYHYFSSKTDLLFFILDSFMDIVLSNLEGELDAIDDGLAKVRRLIFRHVELYPKHMAEARTLFFDVKNLPSRPFKVIVQKEREYNRIAASVLSGYLGSFVEKDRVTAITYIVLSMCNSIYAWYNPKSTIKPDHLSEIIFKIITEGVPGFQKEGGG